MTKPGRRASDIKGEEHWTNKGDVKLFMWEKCAGADPAGPAARSCSCTARRWPRSRPSICRCRAARFLGDGFFRGPRLRHLVRRHGGLWPLDQDARQQRADLLRRRRLRSRDRYILKTARQAPAAGLRHLVGRAARGAVRGAPSRIGRRLALDAIVWTGEGRPTLAERRKRLPEYSRPRTAGRSTAPSCTRSSTRDHPGTADDDVIEAFADAILELDDFVPTGTYVDMCAHLPVVDPKRSRCRPSSCAASTTASRASRIW